MQSPPVTDHAQALKPTGLWDRLLSRSLPSLPPPTEEHREIRVKTSHTFFQKDAVPRGLVPPLPPPACQQLRQAQKK